ncbi:MAG TPA: penicillin-binding transpeptidase domain-containing protein [Thermoanaerobaculia bacterium]|nr:penicillin-binding transpeptidase domain-containing protein [Thermoanaerobaculia bacterium]
MKNREPNRKKLNPFLYALVALLGILYFVLGLPIRKAHGEWEKKNYKAAYETLEEWSRFRLRPAEYDEAMAVTLLSAGQGQMAQQFLDRTARRKPDWLPTFDKTEVARLLVSSQRYEELLAYDKAVHQRGEGPEVALYRVAALVGLDRSAEAAKALAAVDRGAVDAAKYKVISEAVAQRQSGRFPFLLDRSGNAIATYDVASKGLLINDKNFDALIARSGGELTVESQLARLGTAATVETTLDPLVQKAAIEALGSLRGSLVAIDPSTNELLAIASSHPSGPVSNLALEGKYEPGSIMKVLTSIKAVSAGINFSERFPMKCEGLLMVDGRQFRDWAVHGDLTDLNEALAVSCNTAFADLGVRLGRESLLGFLRSAGFDGNADLGVMKVPLGITHGSFYNRFEIANLAVGLEHETVNALHVAMLASMVANRGKFAVPRLLRGRRSILGEPVGVVAQEFSTQVAPREVFDKVIPAMKAVVTDPRGTGKRVAIPGLTVAMKTGTAGKQDKGYDALILAFAPADNPRIAFGVIAEHAGSAELQGARVANEFLKRIKSRLQ